jgi:spore germination protein GerM
MVTVILFFSVVLLVASMLKRGEDPLAAVEIKKPEPGPTAASESMNPEPTREVMLYFAQPDALRLAPEPASIPITESTVENCRRALEAVIQGPRSALAPIVPPSARIRGLYMLENGELVADFSIELELDLKKRSSASLEALMIYGIVTALAQPAVQGTPDTPVKSVRFLIEGQPPRETCPAHVDVSEPVAPNPEWLAAAPADPGQ